MVLEIKDNEIVNSKEKFNLESKDLICIFNKEQWEEINIFPKKNIGKIHFCKIESSANYMYGNLCIPVKNKFPLNYSIIFYIYNNNLIFIDDENIILNSLKKIQQIKNKNEYNIIGLFHDILEMIIKDDLKYLEKIEAKLSGFEDKIIHNKTSNFNQNLIILKKEILRFYHYYGQLLDMTDVLEDSYIKTDEIFKVFFERVERLQNETLLLKDYTQELQNLYESQINLHQNNIMKVLTIVTTIFMPLTLITSWYGMNFKYMPELYWKFSYPLIIIIFIIITIICLIIFKKKKFW